MKESKESYSHYCAKYALAEMLNKMYEGHNCFHVVEYPILEELDDMSFDEFYCIRKKDKAVVSKDVLYDIEHGFSSGSEDDYEAIERVNHCEGGSAYTGKTTFNNLDMPTLKNYIDGGIKVKYFVDVAQIWKGTLAQCFEVKNKNPVATEKLNYLGNIDALGQDVYEISSRYILGFDRRKPNLKKLARELQSKHRVQYTKHTQTPRFDQATMSILGGQLHNYNKTSWRVDEYYR